MKPGDSTVKNENQRVHLSEKCTNKSIRTVENPSYKRRSAYNVYSNKPIFRRRLIEKYSTARYNFNTKRIYNLQAYSKKKSDGSSYSSEKANSKNTRPLFNHAVIDQNSVTDLPAQSFVNAENSLLSNRHDIIESSDCAVTVPKRSESSGSSAFTENKNTSKNATTRPEYKLPSTAESTSLGKSSKLTRNRVNGSNLRALVLSRAHLNEASNTHVDSGSSKNLETAGSSFSDGEDSDSCESTYLTISYDGDSDSRFSLISDEYSGESYDSSNTKNSAALTLHKEFNLESPEKAVTKDVEESTAKQADTNSNVTLKNADSHLTSSLKKSTNNITGLKLSDSDSDSGLQLCSSDGEKSSLDQLQTEGPSVDFAPLLTENVEKLHKRPFSFKNTNDWVNNSSHNRGQSELNSTLNIRASSAQSLCADRTGEHLSSDSNAVHSNDTVDADSTIKKLSSCNSNKKAKLKKTRSLPATGSKRIIGCQNQSLDDSNRKQVTEKMIESSTGDGPEKLNFEEAGVLSNVCDENSCQDSSLLNPSSVQEDAADSNYKKSIEKWKLVPSAIYQHLAELYETQKKNAHMPVVPKKKRKKGNWTRRSFHAKKAPEEPVKITFQDPYVDAENELEIKEESTDEPSTATENMGMILHVGVDRPLFPEVYRNIIMLNEKTDGEITDLWANFALSTLITDKSSKRFRSVFLPIIDTKLKSAVDEYQQKTDCKFQEVDLQKVTFVESVMENSEENPASENVVTRKRKHVDSFDDSSAKLGSPEIVKSSPKKQKLEKSSKCSLYQVDFPTIPTSPLNTSPKSTHMSPVKHVAENSEPVVENSKPVLENSKPVVENSKPVVENSKPVIENSKSVVENSKPVVKNSKPVVENSKPVAENSKPIADNSSPDVEESKTTDEHPISAVEYPEPTVEKLSDEDLLANNGFKPCWVLLPKVPIPSTNTYVDEEDDEDNEHHFFSADHCSRTYGQMFDYRSRNLSLVFFLRIKRILRLQRQNNKLFHSCLYVRLQPAKEDQSDEVDVLDDCPDAIVDSMPFPAEITKNPLDIMKTWKLNVFDAPLLKGIDVNANKFPIRFMNHQLLKSEINAKWFILQLNKCVLNVIHHNKDPLPIELLFQIICRADLTKKVVCYTIGMEFNPDVLNFGVYGVPGLCEAVLVGPYQSEEMEHDLTATVQLWNGESAHIPIFEASFDVNTFFLWNEDTKARSVHGLWWKPGDVVPCTSAGNSFFMNHLFNPTENESSPERSVKVLSLLRQHRCLTYSKYDRGGHDMNFRLIHQAPKLNYTASGLKLSERMAMDNFIVDDSPLLQPTKLRSRTNMPNYCEMVSPKFPVDLRYDSRREPRHDSRKEPRHDSRKEPRHDSRKEPRHDSRKEPRYDPRKDPKIQAQKALARALSASEKLRMNTVNERLRRKEFSILRSHLRSTVEASQDASLISILNKAHETVKTIEMEECILKRTKRSLFFKRKRLVGRLRTDMRQFPADHICYRTSIELILNLGKCDRAENFARDGLAQITADSIRSTGIDPGNYSNVRPELNAVESNAVPSTDHSSEQTSTTESSQPHSTIDSSQPHSTIDSSKQRSTTESSKQRSTTESSKQRSTTDSSKQRSTTDSSKQRSITESSKQRSTTDSSKQRSITESSKQRLITESSKQRLITGSSKQRLITESSKQRLITESSKQHSTPESSTQPSAAELSKQHFANSIGLAVASVASVAPVAPKPSRPIRSRTVNKNLWRKVVDSRYLPRQQPQKPQKPRLRGPESSENCSSSEDGVRAEHSYSRRGIGLRSNSRWASSGIPRKEYQKLMSSPSSLVVRCDQQATESPNDHDQVAVYLTENDLPVTKLIIQRLKSVNENSPHLSPTERRNQIIGLIRKIVRETLSGTRNQGGSTNQDERYLVPRLLLLQRLLEGANIRIRDSSKIRVIDETIEISDDDDQDEFSIEAAGNSSGADNDGGDLTKRRVYVKVSPAGQPQPNVSPLQNGISLTNPRESVSSSDWTEHRMENRGATIIDEQMFVENQIILDTDGDQIDIHAFIDNTPSPKAKRRQRVPASNASHRKFTVLKRVNGANSSDDDEAVDVDAAPASPERVNLSQRSSRRKAGSRSRPSNRTNANSRSSNSKKPSNRSNGRSGGSKTSQPSNRSSASSSSSRISQISNRSNTRGSSSRMNQSSKRNDDSSDYVAPQPTDVTRPPNSEVKLLQHMLQTTTLPTPPKTRLYARKTYSSPNYRKLIAQLRARREKLLSIIAKPIDLDSDVDHVNATDSSNSPADIADESPVSVSDFENISSDSLGKPISPPKSPVTRFTPNILVKSLKAKDSAGNLVVVPFCRKKVSLPVVSDEPIAPQERLRCPSFVPPPSHPTSPSEKVVEEMPSEMEATFVEEDSMSQFDDDPITDPLDDFGSDVDGVLLIDEEASTSRRSSADSSTRLAIKSFASMHSFNDNCFSNMDRMLKF